MSAFAEIDSKLYSPPFVGALTWVTYREWREDNSNNPLLYDCEHAALAWPHSIRIDMARRRPRGRNGGIVWAVVSASADDNTFLLIFNACLTHDCDQAPP